MDLANGHAAALHYCFQHTGFEAINLGTGKGSSVLEVIAAYEKASEKKVPYEIVERRPGDIAVSYANPQKAKDLLGWTATADLAQMCKDSWSFIQRNPEGIS